ncbi:MAG: hypothetical protein R2991_02485 [Thermoanaerobaculia bacterium]
MGLVFRAELPQEIPANQDGHPSFVVAKRLPLRPPSGDRTINKKLFVGNLSYNTGEARLREFFAEAGPILHVSIPADRESGRPRGFAFVEFQTAEDARAALDLLDGRELDGRKLRLSEADRARKSPSRPKQQTEEDGEFHVRHGFEDVWEQERGDAAGRRGRDGWRSLRGTKRSL